MPIPFAKTLPYVLHTNRELGLMLSGQKPLAMFADGIDRYPEVVSRYLRLFDRHVAVHKLARRDCQVGSIHYIYFALPGQEWRIDAMIELKLKDGWSEDDERREGELLGYEDWMNDHFLTLNTAADPTPSNSP